MTHIGARAFANHQFEEIFLPDGIKSVGDKAFANSPNAETRSLRIVYIPKNIEYLAENAFTKLKDSNLTQPHIGVLINLSGKEVSGIEYGEVIDASSKIDLVEDWLFTNVGGRLYRLVTYIGTEAEVKFPSDVKGKSYEISGDFVLSPHVTSVTIPKEFVSTLLPAEELYCLHRLANLVVEEGHPVYDSRENCNAIIETATNKLLLGCRNTMIPETVQTIGEYAFYESGLSDVEIPGSVSSIEEYAFSRTKLKSVKIPGNVKVIGECAFQSNDELCYVEMLEGVETIGYAAFATCPKLEKVVAPNSIASVDGILFEDTPCSVYTTDANVCMLLGRGLRTWILYESKAELYLHGQKVEDFIFPNNGTGELIVPDECFHGQKNIKSLVFPKCYDVIRIGNNLPFYNMPDVETMMIPDCIFEPVDPNDWKAVPFFNRNGNSVSMIVSQISPSNLTKNYGFFANVDKDKCILIVPRGTADAYKSNSGWSDFKYIFEEDFYTATFMVEGEVWQELDFPVGNDIIYPTLPQREGYELKWDKSHTTMPEQDIIITASYLQKYTVTYKVDGEVYKTQTIVSGDAIPAVEGVVKEGYTFKEWAGLPEVMPAQDIVVEGIFEANNYTVTFKIGDEIIYSGSLPYGTEIPVPEAPEKEGHTFAGWGEVAATVPAGDVTYEGSYISNNSTVTFKIGDEIIYSESLPHGTEITVPEAPEKEGHTFAGWGEVDATVPAGDVTYEGSYIPNNYTVTFKIGDEVIYAESLPYGAEITAPQAPEKEGHTFAGWGEVDATVPAGDVTYEGSYSVDHYIVTFKIGDEVIYAESLPYGAEITAPEAPEKEGHTFAGWGEVAATVPAGDVTYEGSYSVDYYIVTFKIGDEVIYSESLPYGTEIPVPEAPEKEGHTFVDWGGVHATVPIGDVTYEGSYTVNNYMLTFVADGKTVQRGEMAYGTAIVAPEAPAKEGHTFAGWAKLPATMPAREVTVTGSYTANSYTVTYKIGEEVILSKSQPYGTAIVAPEAPAKEGYTFAGWGEIADTVPAGDVTYEGSYSVNIYTVYYYVGEELVHAAEVAYGEAIPEYIYKPTTEGDVFVGWVGDTYETMPAHDVVYIADIATDVTPSIINHQRSTIYDLTGRRVEKAEKGIYIVNGKKMVIK